MKKSKLLVFCFLMVVFVGLFVVPTTALADGNCPSSCELPPEGAENYCSSWAQSQTSYPDYYYYLYNQCMRDLGPAYPWMCQNCGVCCGL